MDLRTLTWISHSLQSLRLLPLAAGWVHVRSTRFQDEPWLPWLFGYLIADAAFEVVLLGMAMRSIRTYGMLDLAILPSFALQALILIKMARGANLRGPLVTVGFLVATLCTWEGWHGGLSPKWSAAMVISSLAILCASLWLILQQLLDAQSVPLFQRPAFWLAGSWVVEQGSSMLLSAGTPLFLRTLSPRWIGLPWITHDLICAAMTFTTAKAFLCLKPRSS